MKKQTKQLFAGMLAASFALFAFSCGREASDSTTDTSVLPVSTTQAIVDTSVSTTVPEVTTTEPTSIQTATQTAYRISTEIGYWFPPAALWYYTPAYEYAPAEDYDIEIIIDNATANGYAVGRPDQDKVDGFNLMPKKIVCKLTNKTGESFKLIGSAYIEAQIAFGGYDIDDPFSWVRLPYVDEERASTNRIHVYEGGEGEYIFDLEQCWHDGVGTGTLFEPGLYRLVFFLDDGPHYVSFGIFIMPE